MARVWILPTSLVMCLLGGCLSVHPPVSETATALTCVQCHEPDYVGTKLPPHAASGFGMACIECHGQDAWRPGKFPSHKFPIVSGKHGGIACATCHTDPAQISTFSCINSGCHGKSKTDNKHDEVSTYSYVSAQCYQCHPTGKGD